MAYGSGNSFCGFFESLRSGVRFAQGNCPGKLVPGLSVTFSCVLRPIGSAPLSYRYPYEGARRSVPLGLLRPVRKGEYGQSRFFDNLRGIEGRGPERSTGERASRRNPRGIKNKGLLGSTKSFVCATLRVNILVCTNLHGMMR